MEICIVNNKYYFIVNMSGGSGRVKKVWDKVKNELNAHNIDYKAFTAELLQRTKK